MRVMIVGLSAPTQLNGVSRHAANIVRGMLSLPDPPEIHLLAGEWQTAMFERAIGSNDARLQVHCIPIRHSNYQRIRWYYRDLPRLARQLRADVVHLSYTMPLDARAFPCPTVVSLHDLYPFDIPENFGMVKGAVNRYLMHQCLQTVDAIACVSETTRRLLRGRFGGTLNRKAVTILNSVEPVPVASAHRPQELNGDSPFLLCIAQHRQNKNIPLVLTVFERLIRNRVVREDTKLLVVGISGPDTSQIHARIGQCGLERNVILLTGISEGELQWCYRNCELLLAPSSIEGFGLPVAEALLAGCPVVCSDIPAFREIGVDLCRYVPFGERIVERYKDAIREALAAPRMHPVPMPHLSPGVIAREYLELYARLQASRRASQPGLLLYADPPADELDRAEVG